MIRWLLQNKNTKICYKLSKTSKNQFKETTCYKKNQMKPKIKQKEIERKLKVMIKWSKMIMK